MIYGHGETILLVEDEPAVLDACQAMLEHLNYRVLPAANGEQAMAVYAAHKDEIALVLTDMVMPKMDGQNLFEALRAQDPNIKVLLMTGYPLDEDTQQSLIEGLVDWLLKPVMPAQLALAVSQALR